VDLVEARQLVEGGAEQLQALFAASRPELLIDEGAYLARVDRSASARGGDPSPALAPRGRSAARFGADIGLVRAEASPDGSDAEVELWFDDREEDTEIELRARWRVEDAATDTSPFGSFTLDYAGLAGGGLGSALIEGSLATSGAGFTLFESTGDVFAVPLPGSAASLVQAAASIEPDGSGGVVKVVERTRRDDGDGDSGVVTHEHLLAFDATTVSRTRDGEDQPLADRTDGRELVWRYELFHATGPEAGSLVVPDQGFAIVGPDGDPGHFGAGGAEVAADVVLSAGDVVRRPAAAGEGEDELLTLVDAPGRLLRCVREDLDLAGLEHVPFEWARWDGVEGATVLERVRWSGGLWTAYAAFDFDSRTWEPVDPARVLDTATLGFLSLWSEAVGGPAAWVHGSNELFAYERFEVDEEDDVFLGADELELFGLFESIGSRILADEAERGEVFLDEEVPADAHRFEFHVDDLTLYHDTGSALRRVGLAAGEVPDGGVNGWGLVSGALVPDLTGVAGPADVFALDEHYVWETGANAWNRHRGFRNAGSERVRVERPLRFEYEHDAADDRNGEAGWAGRSVVLTYHGPGRLEGIPLVEVDLDGDLETDRFEPAFQSADGTRVGPGGAWVVRAVDVEERLAGAPPGSAPSTVSASDLVVPGSDVYDPPTIGSAPELAEAPRVVEGERVDGGDVVEP